MVEEILQCFENNSLLAVGISIILNISISVLGFIPSVFITAANISFFGFGKGLILSILGEALGAMISFYLYRKGINKVKTNVSINNKHLNRLQQTKGMEAFLLILASRVFPFVPSGLVTLASAGSNVGMWNFSIASTLGKIPALVIEAYSTQQILNWSWQGKVILGISSVIIISILIRKRTSK
ncbi:VTT domain-containing protein [Sporosarcina sp. E16_8]|uniref:TVP38/TMEM64 family protein n=1 Tax=Sporosarcina sp. E16_8 TaxID=2789295 RepID=UPI001A910EFC|nr:VTT domain-containing protein [Sporosarcina sp. E16_8]MBO0587715.1 VTT domain-containing protein [Sporosarcina sp. E16_8]